jgi:hypothetical protein
MAAGAHANPSIKVHAEKRAFISSAHPFGGHPTLALRRAHP